MSQMSDSALTVAEILGDDPAATDVAAPRFPPLTVHDRCDRCGAQAWTRWCQHLEKHPEQETDLLFCAHHTGDHYDALVKAEFELVVDQRDQINQKGGASA